MPAPKDPPSPQSPSSPLTPAATVPFTGRAGRKRILERARRSLSAALDDEPSGEADAVGSLSPGQGKQAWWLS